jgi:hypothetical protein
MPGNDDNFRGRRRAPTVPKAEDGPTRLIPNDPNAVVTPEGNVVESPTPRMTAKPTSADKVGAPLTRRRLFYNFVRRRASKVLADKHGYDLSEANEVVSGVTDKEIDDLAERRKLNLAGGGFLDWLKANGPKILEIIMAIVSILSMFATPKVLAVKLKDDEDEEETDESDTGEDDEDEEEDETK